MLEELETGKRPTTDTLETFLVNAVVVAEFVASEKQTSLVTPQKLGKIVNNNFEQTLCLEWAKCLLKLKDECKTSFVSSDARKTSRKLGKQAMETKYSPNFAPCAKNLSPYTEQ